MTDPNADPTPTELAEWRAADLAAAEKWAAGRLARARQLGDVEVLQHLGHLLAEVAAHEADLLAIEGQRADLAARLFAQETELEALRAVADAARDMIDADDPYGEVREGSTRMDVLVDTLDALPAQYAATSGAEGDGGEA